jgi:osmotically-inducible protein OsmY
VDVEYQYLVARLQDALAADSRVNTLDIRVLIVGGRIHLIGEVPTEERREAIHQVTREVLPGHDVRNELTVLELSHAARAESVQ